jgi:hypothetical protein
VTFQVNDINCDFFVKSGSFFAPQHWWPWLRSYLLSYFHDIYILHTPAQVFRSTSKSAHIGLKWQGTESPWVSLASHLGRRSLMTQSLPLSYDVTGAKPWWSQIFIFINLYTRVILAIPCLDLCPKETPAPVREETQGCLLQKWQ